MPSEQIRLASGQAGGQGTTPTAGVLTWPANGPRRRLGRVQHANREHPGPVPRVQTQQTSAPRARAQRLVRGRAYGWRVTSGDTRARASGEDGEEDEDGGRRQQAHTRRLGGTTEGGQLADHRQHRQ
ncbi:uncharacterized protein B0H18DRAFT_951809 [Fomitopsis serialis]|uniref:uncharacterized protein n=1 Tax=Fomitopsis serialis TaxID=139415 RepID=UPI00200815F7|nr:uncharacterized protein B0H18DRAFT_951809 [Neoantrodia serialis]KAH9933842.1 hypothetical protein B0H18DRAFT_951809 [Neoantrodia serialis]